MDSSSGTPLSRRAWRDTLQANLTSGFLVFLIALPLCLAIASASCFPPVAGVITAIIGGLVTPWISNSELTIKGPAAGLIVIVAGCAMSFGWVADNPEAQWQAYRCTLAVGVVAGLLQIAFALLRSGVVSELFPTSVVHGMLAAIGIIIISKQSHLMLGATPVAKEPLHLLAEIPHSILHGLNPEVALIGVVSLSLLFLWPHLKFGVLKRIPAPLMVILVSIPLGLLFDMDHPVDHPHSYSFAGHTYEVSDKYLVAVPKSLISAITTPDFSRVLTADGALWIAMFCLIGSLESILSAKAVDLLDPQRRRSDFNRDLLAVGVGNTIAAMMGGLPMISEIVRSRANIDNGAKSRFSNLFHGLFLLLFLLAVPSLIHRIPLAALASILVYTGVRLASPSEFKHMYHLGLDQLTVFVGTVAAVLSTDLLVGIAIGTVIQVAMHLIRGATFRDILRPSMEITVDGDAVVVRPGGSVLFSTWIGFRRHLMAQSPDHSLIVDFSSASIVDHTVLAKLDELRRDWQSEGRTLEITGLDQHRATSSHPLASRRRQVQPENALSG